MTTARGSIKTSGRYYRVDSWNPKFKKTSKFFYTKSQALSYGKTKFSKGFKVKLYELL